MKNTDANRVMALLAPGSTASSLDNQQLIYFRFAARVALFVSCLALWNSLGTALSAQEEKLESSPPEYRYFVLYDPNSSVLKSNPEPPGYLRPEDSVVSGFGVWLRHFPMRSPKEPLTTYAGGFLAAPEMIGGALDLSTPAPSQDAKGVLYRLMIEYARHHELEMDVFFPGMANDTVSFYKYVTGTYRTNASRNKLFWREGDPRAIDDGMIQRLTLFANSVTTYLSLIRDCDEVEGKDVMPGDIFIQADSVAQQEAQLVIVLDVATRDTLQTTELAGFDKKLHNKLYLFANSLTPGTNLHIIKPLKPGKANWFYLGELQNKYKAYGHGKYYRIPYAFLR